MGWWLALLLMGVAKGRMVGFCDLFFRYTLDMATEFLFGGSVGSLELPKHEVAKAFEEVQRIQNLITNAGYVLHSKACVSSR